MADVRVAIHDHIKSIPNVKELAINFKQYKKGLLLPDNFGRDAGYDHPNTPKVVRDHLWHMHLAPADQPFNPDTPQSQRVNRKGDGKCDRILVYTKGFLDENAYMLMAILAPDGHRLQRDHLNIMIPLAAKADADFRARY